MPIIFFILCTFLTQALADDCGLKGTIQERIEHCKHHGRSTRFSGKLQLVSQSKKSEAFFDSSTKILWVNLSQKANYADATSLCQNLQSSNLVLLNLIWRIPSLKEFQRVLKNGYPLRHPYAFGWNWSSTPSPKLDQESYHYIYPFGKDEGNANSWATPTKPSYKATVTCVSELKF